MIKLIKRLVSVISAAAVAVFIIAGAVMPVSAQDEMDLEAKAEEIVILVNEARIERGLKPLYMVPYLNEVANVRVKEITEVFGHYRPNGELFIDALDTSIVSYSAAAENIAAGLSTAEGTFNQWKNSEGHWSSIISSDYTHIGVGVYYDPACPYKWYWSQFFIANENVLEGQYVPERYKVVPISAGDVNGDGFVDIYDYILLMKYKMGSVVFNDLQIKSADCMADGEITIADCVVLRKYILGAYPTLPVSP